MKRTIYTTVFLLACFSLFAQSKDEKALAERTYLLSHTVFGTQDSLTVEDLFAKKASYGHSTGRVENRQEAIAGIVQAKAVYSDTSLVINNIVQEGKVAVVRTTFRSKQAANPGTSPTPLNLHIMLVWVKEKGKWRLMGRQAVRLT